MKALFVIDVDTDELGEAVATITANNTTFSARGVIRPLPQKMTMEKALKMERVGAIKDIYTTWNACLDEILGDSK